ncbi:hypothetical protein HNQ96_005978 [Aminobacter lissarensis]|uniref:Uncharacterized protein n=1 Tax=Aminobacter carboxidus TaxID=376165 RepID=A0A8E1WLB1_9HYPH|nr:hypothetical protein [Aminobacter lissarensis]MBB6470084.1 hypothetical protein [Aminobacter lissarensis]
MVTIDEEIEALRMELAEETDPLENDVKKKERRQAFNVERGKLIANALDRASTAIIALGIFTPALNAYYGSVVDTSMTPVGQVFGVFACFAVAYLLHLLGQESLEKGYSI